MAGFRILCLLLCMPGLAYAQPSESRGALLYATHCNACHGTEIHWRSKKLVTDWNSLMVQVRRWQASSNLHWGNEEITEVARYLNMLFYGFPEPGHQGYSLNEKLPQR